MWGMERLGVVQTTLSGVFAAGFAAGVTTCIDTVKINLQLTDDKSISGFELMKRLVRKNGLAFLWKGTTRDARSNFENKQQC